MTSLLQRVERTGRWELPGTEAEAEPTDTAAAEILAESGRCVACGLCVPKCPTYQKTLHEADSPRGRIALMRGAVEGRIPFNDRLREHLDLCLGCRACEAACPNGVAYGSLYDRARALPEMRRDARHRVADYARRFMTANAFRYWGSLLRFYQRSGVQRIVRRTGWLRRFGLDRVEGFLPTVPDAVHFQPFYRAQGSPIGEVLLFLGCVARIFDVEALQAAIYVLTRLGYGVHIPPRQGCCGAMHGHAGDAATARSLAETNWQAFGVHPDLPILCTASGCGARLVDYAQHYGEHGRTLARRVQDISAFVAQAPGWEQVTVVPLTAKVAVHEPCTLRNVMRSGGAAARLLARIPDLAIDPLPGNDKCCGAAGTYFLSQPAMADALRADKLEAIRALTPRFLVTSNIGCALFLAQGLRSSPAETAVLHPLTLVARQLGFNGRLS